MRIKNFGSVLLITTLSSVAGCASTTVVDSLPLTVMANIEPIDNKNPISYKFTPCSTELCKEAGLGGLRIGGKYAVTYSPNLSVNKLYNDYFNSKFFNTAISANNFIDVQLLSVEESYEQMNSGSDFFRSPDDISVTYSFSFKLKIKYTDSNGEVNSYPAIAKKTITSTQSQIASDIRRGVSDAIGLTIVRFDKFLSEKV